MDFQENQGGLGFPDFREKLDGLEKVDFQEKRDGLEIRVGLEKPES